MKVRDTEAKERPPLSVDRFRASPEFRKFKGIMRNLLSVTKPELDRMVEQAKKDSPRAGNPNAPGRKPKKP